MSVCVYMYVLCICSDLKFYIMDVTRMFFNGKFKYVFNNSISKITKYSWYSCRGLCTCDL